jgi:pimeloyl-ACP methyl ester carboxylesterase
MSPREDAVTGQMVTVAGQALRIWRRPGEPGQPPLVLCNGIGSSLDLLMPFAEALDPAIGVIAFDVPGVGGSPLPRGPTGSAASRGSSGTLRSSWGTLVSTFWALPGAGIGAADRAAESSPLPPRGSGQHRDRHSDDSCPAACSAHHGHAPPPPRPCLPARRRGRHLRRTHAGAAAAGRRRASPPDGPGLRTWVPVSTHRRRGLDQPAPAAAATAAHPRPRRRRRPDPPRPGHQRTASNTKPA